MEFYHTTATYLPKRLAVFRERNRLTISVCAKENFGLFGIEIHILIIFFVCIDDALKSDNVAPTLLNLLLRLLQIT